MSRLQTIPILVATAPLLLSLPGWAQLAALPENTDSLSETDSDTGVDSAEKNTDTDTSLITDPFSATTGPPPAAPPTTSESAPVESADPSLIRLRDALAALNTGIAPPSNDIDSLFNVPVDDPEAVTGRIAALPKEITQLEARLSQLAIQIDEADAQTPAVERPALLDAPPSAPVPPVAPVPPEKPKKGMTAKDFNGESPRAYYRKALAAYEEELAAYRQSQAKYDEALAAFETETAAYQAAQIAFEEQTALRNRQVKNAIDELQSESAAVTLRLEVARLRFQYLTAVAKLLGRLSEPALLSFQSLDESRAALRNRANVIVAIHQSAAKLLGRTQTLRDRAAAGSLLGFQVQRDDLAANLDGDISGLKERIEKARALGVTLIAIADQLEQEGAETKKTILSAALKKDQTAFLDKAFLTKLRQTRKAARAQTGFTVSDTELADVNTELGRSIPKPASLGTVADAQTALLPMRSAVEHFDKILDAIPLGLDRHRQAFARELVTVYSSLASDQAKAHAYSLSTALLEDFVSDLNMLRVEISLWAETRITAVSMIPRAVSRTEGMIRIARIFGGLLIVVFLFGLRKPIRKKVAGTFLHLVNRRTFRRRAGTLVRLTVFLLALVPILLAAGAGYALLGLVGFDYPEIRIAEVAFRWGIFYFLVRQIVRGLTTRESRGRPPLIEMSPSNARLLAKTYARLGLFLALIAAVDEWTTQWLGTGSLSMVVRLAATFWAAVWTLWALFAWRIPLAASCAGISPEGSRRQRFAGWAENHFAGVLLTPVLLLWYLPVVLWRALRRMLAEGGMLSYFRARALRRMSRKTQSEAPGPMTSGLPEQYVRQFPLYPLQGEEGEILLPRRSSMTAASNQIARWRETRQDGSLVVIGEKGIGKTTFLALLEKEIKDLTVTRHTLGRKMRSPQMLLDDLGEIFGLDKPKNLGALARHLNDGPERVVLLDEAHNVFLRAVDGFKPVDALVSLVDFTSEKVFWVLVFNKYSWAFLTKANRHVQSFRKQLRLPAWSQAELQDLVARRNKNSGITVEFDEVLLDAETSSTGGFELISSADGFFRLLFEASRGNPRVATYLWLGSLTRISDERLRAGLIREESTEFFSKLDTEFLFALASIAQHENMSFSELQQALNISLDEAAQAGRYLLENNILEPKHSDVRRMTLAPRFHHQVLRVLKAKNLLYLED